MAPSPVSVTTPSPRSYESDYFMTLYGAVPSQTLADKLRDMLIRWMVSRYIDGGALLEIGCGYGYLLERFDRRFKRHGTDISAHAIGVAARRLPDARLAVADIQDGVPFHEPFAAIIAVNVMEHLPAPERGMAAIATHLKYGGIFVAHLPTISSRLAAWFYARSYARDATHVYRPSGQLFNRLAAEHGLRVRQALYFPFWPSSLWRKLRPHPSYLAVFVRE